MSAQPIEERLQHLEAEVARLKSLVDEPQKKDWRSIVGTFEDDPIFAEAMELGRKYRESLRPKMKKSKKKKKNES